MTQYVPPPLFRRICSQRLMQRLKEKTQQPDVQIITRLYLNIDAKLHGSEMIQQKMKLDYIVTSEKAANWILYSDEL